MFSSFWTNRSLIYQLLKREIQSRYKGSLLGILWSFVTPLMMLFIYTFVFEYIFKARWNIEGDVEINFAMMLFTGLIVHGLLSEVLTRSPLLIVGKVNFVKKVVFPLEILPWVSLLSSTFNFLIGFLLLLGFILIEMHSIPITALLYPLVVLPYFLLLLGLSWILAALGVYLRDIEHVMGTFATLLLFMSPIFFSSDRLPVWMNKIIYLNPISLIVEESREVLIMGNLPDFVSLGKYLLVAIIVAILGKGLFSKLQRGFADVL